jgi:hypothetical protein
MLGEARVEHVTPKRLRPRSLGAKAAATVVLDAHAVLSVHPKLSPVSVQHAIRFVGPAWMAQSEKRWGPR